MSKRSEDARMALYILREARNTLALAKGYIRITSEQRHDGGLLIVREIEERLAELEALCERFSKVSK